MLRNCVATASALGRLAAQGHAVRAMSAGRVVVGAGKSKRARLPRKAVMEVVRRPPLAVPSLPELASRFTVHLSPTQLHALAASQTETAAARINELLTGRRKTEEVVAVRVGIKSRGCNGLSYTMNYATDEPKRGEEAVEQHGAARPSASPTPLCNRVVPAVRRRARLRGAEGADAHHRHHDGLCSGRAHLRVCLP